MKKLLLFCTVFVCLHNRSVAQQKFSLHSINSAGLLNGSSGSGYSLQSVLGLSFKQSFAGLGVGIDQYTLRSVPLFVDLRQEFGHALHHFFMYADAGYNTPWLTANQRNGQSWQLYNGRMKGGLYYDAGIGVAVRLKNADALLLSLGYSYKEMADKATTNFCNLTGCSGSTDTYNYHLKRIIIKAGWKF